jgi:hypothetical protein
MKQEIKQWLQGPRIFTEGAALYEKHGYNKRLKTIFGTRSDDATKDILVYELANLAGFSEQEVKEMPRFAKKEVKPELKVETPKIMYIDDLLLELASQLHVEVDDLFAGAAVINATPKQIEVFNILAPAYKEVPETMKKVIRIREKYPFLKDKNCPVELKELVHNMFCAYDAYREAYVKLDPANSQYENLAIAATVVENYLDNRAMWEELDHYNETGEILGKHEMFDLLKMRAEIAAMPDMDIISKLKNVKPNVTKARTALDKAATDEKRTECIARLDKWTTYVAELEAEIDRRKK